jgi:hypothetical protein
MRRTETTATDGLKVLGEEKTKYLEQVAQEISY